MELVFTILIGVVFEAVDAFSMFLKKMDKANCLSAFVQYMVVTFIIFNSTLFQLNVNEFLVGSVISFLMALPMVAMITKTEKKAVPIVFVNSVFFRIYYSGNQAFHRSVVCMKLINDRS